MDATEFGNRLRALRKGAGATIPAESHAVGIAQGTWWRYEHGRQSPRMETLVALAEHYGVTVGYLLGVEESSPRAVSA